MTDAGAATFSIERIPIPASLSPDDPATADFIASVDARNASETRAYGTPDVAYPPDELLPHWHDPHEPKVLWVARVSGRVVARAVYETQLGPPAPDARPAIVDTGAAAARTTAAAPAPHPTADIAWIDIDVHPDFEHHGIGRALADTVEQHARAHNHTRLVCYTVSPPGSGPDIAAPTGHGGVPANNREVRFLTARGYHLEQVERASRFALPADPAALAVRRASAERAAGPDYRVLCWAGPTPIEHLPDLARLLTRMSTDAPSAGLDEPEDVWTPERVAAHERRLANGPRSTLTAVAEYVPDGRLVGFTQLSVPHDVTRPVSQDDTLVLREHRGHRLGLLLKVSNLQFLEDRAPGHPSVLTWNAEENRYMLSVNESLGFTPIGAEGAWRLDL